MHSMAFSVCRNEPDERTKHQSELKGFEKCQNNTTVCWSRWGLWKYYIYVSQRISYISHDGVIHDSFLTFKTSYRKFLANLFLEELHILCLVLWSKKQTNSRRHKWKMKSITAEPFLYVHMPGEFLHASLGGCPLRFSHWDWWECLL